MKLIAIFLFCSFAFSIGADGRTRKPKQLKMNKLSCTSREIQRRDCTLRLGKIKVDAYQQRWRINNQKWIEVSDLPIVEETAQWQELKMISVGKIPLLEVRLWAPAKGEAELEDLHWYLYDLSQMTPRLQAQAVMQRRRVNEEKRKPASKVPYQYEKPEVVKIEARGGKVFWSVGRTSGSF